MALEAKIVQIPPNSKLEYSVYAFFSVDGIPFRVIYTNTGKKNSAWKLDTKTGLWGCFIDAMDIGFDAERVAKKLFDENRAVTLAKQKAKDTPIVSPKQLEQIDYEVMLVYFAEMMAHIEWLFQIKLPKLPPIQPNLG
jgi:hypothetical protein